MSLSNVKDLYKYCKLKVNESVEYQNNTCRN